MSKTTASKKKTAKKKTAKKSPKNTKLQTVKQKVPAIVQSDNPMIAMIQVIERIALNPEVDVDKMEKVMALQERMMDRQAESEFNSAMTDVQANMPVITKDGYNEHTKSYYSKHETIVKAIKPIYTKEGFAISFSEAEIPQVEGKPRLIKIVGVLRHRSGHSETYFTVLPIDTTGSGGTVNKTGVHGTGSTITYGRRYLTCMIFDVATGDDNDGNAVAENVVERTYITEEQVNILDSKIRENKVSMPGLLNWMKRELKIKSLATIPDNFYDYVDKQIDRVINNKAA